MPLRTRRLGSRAHRAASAYKTSPRTNPVSSAVRAVVEALESRWMLTTSTYTGHVFIDDGGTGTYDPEDRSLSGWTVKLHGNYTDYETQTDGSGGYSFTIPDLQDGLGNWYSNCADLELVMSGHNDFTATIPENITPDPDPHLDAFGGSTDNLDFGVAPIDAPDTANCHCTCDNQDYSNDPVRYGDGQVKEVATDLPDQGVLPWGQTRSWTNNPAYDASGRNGNGWVSSELPQLEQDSAAGTMAVVNTGFSVQVFDGSGSSYSPRHHSDDSLISGISDDSSGDDEFVETRDDGSQMRFYTFDSSLPVFQRGTFKSYTDAAGNRISAYSHDSEGHLTEIRGSTTTGGTTAIDSYVYAYYSSGTGSDGRIESITFRRSTDGGSTFTTIRTVNYAYYDGSGTGENAFGTAGDLKTAIVKDGSGTTLDTSYYRYYVNGDSNGYSSGLKYVFDSEAYARLAAALSSGTTPLNATNSQVDAYAYSV